MNPFVSVDIETTGLDPDWCQILEIGMVVDLDGVTPVEELPSFHSYVIHDRIVGEPFALAMNAEILRRIANRKSPWQYMHVDTIAVWLSVFLEKYGLHKRGICAGKNFGSFDRQFLRRLPNFTENISLHHRNLDPGNMYWEPELDGPVPPDSKTCMTRAGIPGEVAHTALEDAQEVVKMVRNHIVEKRKFNEWRNSNLALSA